MIRRATLTDLPQLARLFDGYRQFYKQESNLAAAEEFLKHRFENEESIVFVAASDAEPSILVGFVQLYPSFTSVGLKKTWILNDLYVDPSARGEKIGEQLMLAATKFSAASGARNLMLQTAKTNEVAQKLYEKLGWAKDEKYFTYYLHH